MLGHAGNEGDGPSGGPLRDLAIAEALRSAVAQKGPALLYAPAVLQHQLEEGFPRATADIAQLLIALDEQVPQTLLGVYADDERSALKRTLVDRLHAQRGLDRNDAQWAVDTWAQALLVGPSRPVPFFADAPPPDPVDDARVDAVATPIARPFTAWRTVAGGVVALIVAALAIGGMQLWSTSRSDPSRVLDALSTTAPAKTAVSVPDPAPAPVASQPATPTPAEPAPVARGEPIPPPVVAPALVAPAVAPAAHASAITDIVVPPDVVAGRRFALAIHYQAGDRPPVAIERRVVQVGAKTVNVVRTTSLNRLAAGETGTLRYPVPALSSAERRTYLFTLIDADGARSASTRVVVDSVAAAAHAAVVAPACTRDTCGTVASMRAVARGYELSVKMDDRTVRTITHATRVKVGARVRWSGGKLTTIAAAPTSRKTTK